MPRYIIIKLLAVVTVLGLIPLYSNAQPVIRPRDIPNQPGVELAYWTAADTVNGIQVDVGQAGEDRVWDLTAYQFEDVTFDTLLDPEAAPDRETFPTANRVLHSTANDLGLNLGTGYQYEIVADSGWYMLGVAGDAGILDRPLAYPTPMMVMPMPAEYGAEWDIGTQIRFGFPPPDTLREMLGELAAFVDSIYIQFELGGAASLDGWGIVRFSGGEVRALRQKISTRGSITVLAVGRILGRRFEQEIPGLGYEIQASLTYRWFAAGVGEIASITSTMGEEDPNFNVASQVRVRRIVPQMVFPQDPLVFGEVAVGNSRAASLYFGNQGEGIGIISRIEFSDDLASEIEVLTELPNVIEKDSTARIRFLWSPLQERTLEGQWALIYHNDPTVNSPLSIALEGNTPNFNGVKGEAGIINEFSLNSIYPNPFNSTTTITFSVGQVSKPVSLRIYDLSGREVYTAVAAPSGTAGEHRAVWNASGAPTGMYVVRLGGAGKTVGHKLVLTR